jgi:MEMO1 family protein
MKKSSYSSGHDYLMKGIYMIISLSVLLCCQAIARDIVKEYHSGMFYPADPNVLHSGMDTFFHEPPTLVQDKHKPLALGAKQGNTVLAIISPHARFDASGPVSAQAFKAVRSQKVNRVYLLAPRHRIIFHGVALPKCPAFQTPLGNLQVDREAVSKLKYHRLFFSDDAVFVTDDHAIELQLPFIRYTFGNVPIVPIMVGDLRSRREIQLVARTLKQQLVPGDLVIISMDFTHYGAKYNFSPYKNNVMQNIKELDFKAYDYIAHHDLDGFMAFRNRTRAPLCGFTPCCILLAMLPEQSTAYMLDYDNCDRRLGTMKSKGFTVSYMAVAFTGRSWFVE